jgi:hypothetical protein
MPDPINLVLRLDARWCADGVEMIRLDDPPVVRAPRFGKAEAVWFICRSDRYRREIIRETIDLMDDPLVLRFVNAGDDDKLTVFLSRFGLPGGFIIGAPRPAEPRNFVLGRQRELRRLLLDAGSGDVATATKAANRALRLSGRGDLSLRPDGRMALTVETLVDFMSIEVAMVAAYGTRVRSCERCGKLLLYGRRAGGRSTVKFCSDRCRLSVWRANQSSKGG